MSHFLWGIVVITKLGTTTKSDGLKKKLIFFKGTTKNKKNTEKSL